MPVAHDFRSADVAAGGQGAPLAPVYHAALARELPKPLAVLNIGGVANVTWIGADGDAGRLRHRPGQRAAGRLDARATPARAFDRDGALARSGPRRTPPCWTRLLAHPYFARPPPKSLDRLDFAAALAASGLAALSPADGAATLVAFTAAAVARTPLPAPPRRWLVGGGGRRNPAIMAALAARLPAPVAPVEAVGWDGDALEAQCFGFLAARVRRGLPLSFPGTTGVAAPLPGGAHRRALTSSDNAHFVVQRATAGVSFAAAQILQGTGTHAVGSTDAHGRQHGRTEWLQAFLRLDVAALTRDRQVEAASPAEQPPP